MCIHCGGGLAISLVGIEISSSSVSHTFSQVHQKFSTWFKPSNPQVEAIPPLKPQGEGIFKKFYENIKKIFETVQSLLEEWVKNIQKDLKGLVKFTSQQDQPQQESAQQIPKADWKDFLSGLWILWGFKYRDIFKVEFGSFIYLLTGLFLDMEKLGWTKQAIIESFKGFNQRFEKGLIGLLSLLIQLNEMGKEMSKLSNSSQSSQKSKRFPIEINKRNIKWFGVGSHWVHTEQKKIKK